MKNEQHLIDCAMTFPFFSCDGIIVLLQIIALIPFLFLSFCYKRAVQADELASECIELTTNGRITHEELKTRTKSEVLLKVRPRNGKKQVGNW